MEETDAETDVEVEMMEDLDEVEKVVVTMEDLERGMKEMFGGWALTTRIEKERNRVVVAGDGWQFSFEGDGRLVFKPDGASYRLVRSVEGLESVGHEEGDEEKAVSFVFPEEKITLRRGVEHHR